MSHLSLSVSFLLFSFFHFILNFSKKLLQPAADSAWIFTRNNCPPICRWPILPKSFTISQIFFKIVAQLSSILGTFSPLWHFSLVKRVFLHCSYFLWSSGIFSIILGFSFLSCGLF